MFLVQIEKTSKNINLVCHLAPWCSGCHYCTTSFNWAWTQVLCRFNTCSRRVGDSPWWGSLTMVPAGNKAKHISSVNHTTKQFIIIIIFIEVTFIRVVLFFHVFLSFSFLFYFILTLLIKVNQCRFENLSICLYSYKNTLKISHF